MVFLNKGRIANLLPPVRLIPTSPTPQKVKIRQIQRHNYLHSSGINFLKWLFFDFLTASSTFILSGCSDPQDLDLVFSPAAMAATIRSASAAGSEAMRIGRPTTR